MLLHCERNGGQKKTILRDIYVDNLKIAGKRTPHTSIEKKARSRIPFLRIITVIIAVTVGILIHQKIGRRVTNADQQPPLPLAQALMEDSVNNYTPDIKWAIELPRLGSEYLLDERPYPRWYAPVDPGVDDDDLLRAANAPAHLSLFQQASRHPTVEPEQPSALFLGPVDLDLGIKLPIPGSERLPYQFPYWSWNQPVDQSVEDFDLLLTANDAVRLSSLFGLVVKTIVIDPGHGGRDPGAIGARGTREKDITLDVALKLKKRLDALNRYQVLLTRENDRRLSLADRIEFAKTNSADVFISIHVNSQPDETVNLIETYYFGAPLNIQSLRLAEQENKDSHFSVGELDTIIKDIGNTLKRQESAMLAADIQKSLFKNLKREDAEIHDSGIKMAPFVVLSQIEVPSVLVEISCISKAEEEAKLASAGYREKVASYLERGIVAYLETQHVKIAKGENKNE